MSLDDALCNRQSKTCTELCGGLGLPVAVENMVEMLGRNSRTGIGDRKPHLIVLMTCENADLPAFRRELYRIADEIREHLQNTLAVGRDGNRMIRRHARDSELGSRSERSRGLSGFLNQRLHVHGNRVYREAACLYPRDVQQVLDQPVGPCCRALDDFELASRLYAAVICGRDLEQERRCHMYGMHRIPEVVRDDRDEIVPGARRVLRGAKQAGVLERNRGELRQLSENRFIRLVELGSVLLVPQLDRTENLPVAAGEIGGDRVRDLESGNLRQRRVRVGREQR